MLWFLWCNILQPKYESLRLFSCHSNVGCVWVWLWWYVCLLCHSVCLWIFVCVYAPTVVFFQHLLVAHLSWCVIPHSTHCSYFLQTEFTFSSNNSYMTELHTNHFSLAFSSSRCHIALIFFLFNCLEWNQNARDSERWTIEAHAVVLRVQHRKCIFFPLWHTISSCWFALCIVTEYYHFGRFSCSSCKALKFKQEKKIWDREQKK